MLPMAYGVDPEPFYVLQRRLAELPEPAPKTPGELEPLLLAFLDAFDCLLRLVFAILTRCTERANEKRSYRRAFLPIFNRARERTASLLAADIREGLADERLELIEMAYALRDSLVVDEMVTLDQSLAESEKTADPEDHADAAETVTDSVKKFITKFLGGRLIGKKRVESILETIDEIISVVKKVV